MMGNPRTPEDTETLLKNHNGFQGKTHTKGENEKAGPVIRGRADTNLGLSLKRNSPVTDQRCQFASVRLEKHSC